MILDKIRNRLKLEIKLYSLKRAVKTIERNPDNALLIFSDPRGGSTWLAEILNTISNSFIYWEPLALNYVTQVKKLGFGWRQHIPVETNWPQAKHLFNDILSVKIINEWTVQKIVHPEQFQEDSLPIIKICRGNHLLEWLVNQYNFRYKPIYLVRHPLAVVASQMKQGGWDYHFDGFKIPKMKFNDYYLKHEKFLKKLKTKEEALLATWCITNKELLANESPQWLKVHYEELVLNPKKELGRIFNTWNFDSPVSIDSMIEKWSSTSINEGEYKPKSQLEKWKSDFNKTQLKELQRILDYFEIEEYCVDKILPKGLHNQL